MRTGLRKDEQHLPMIYKVYSLRPLNLRSFPSYMAVSTSELGLTSEDVVIEMCVTIRAGSKIDCNIVAQKSRTHYFLCHWNSIEYVHCYALSRIAERLWSSHGYL